MKTKKLFSMLAVALMMVVSTPLLGDVDEDPVYDLGEVTITCSSKGYGRCYYPKYIWAASNELCGEYTCIVTGNPENNCSHLLIKVLNFFLPEV